MTTNHQKTRANYDCLSRWYDLLSASGERTARLLGLQMLDVQPKERVLEVGCGTGELLPALASRAGPAGWVFGLDLSARMLGIAKNKLEQRPSSNIALLQGDGARLPFPEGSFNVVFLSFTLELFDDAEIPAVLSECRRVLLPEGRLGIVSLLKKDRPRATERLYAWAHRQWPSVIDCKPISLINVLKHSGFTIYDVEEQFLWGLTVGVATAHPTWNYVA